MQNLDVISVNIWHILISLINLVLLFLIVKKFLFKPVRRLFAERQAALEHQYAAAAELERQANVDREAWAQKLQGAETEADRILREAADLAKYRAEQIVEDANARADGIIRRAEAEANLTKKKATEGIKREIVDVSAAIAEKMLEREVNTQDHRAMIGSFIDRIGEDDGGDR